MQPVRIIDLNSVPTLAAGDQVPIYSATNGDARRISASALAAFVGGTVTTVDNKVTQYSSPSASPFTVTVAPLAAGGSVFLLLTPTGTLANGTIVLPAAGAAQDRQEVLVKTTQAITTLAITAPGLSVDATAPTTAAAGAHFRLRYDAINSTWYSV